VKLPRDLSGGDKDLLVRKSFRDIQIARASDFLKVLTL
jgi:hypothetical protein